MAWCLRQSFCEIRSFIFLCGLCWCPVRSLRRLFGSILWYLSFFHSFQYITDISFFIVSYIGIFWYVLSISFHERTRSLLPLSLPSHFIVWVAMKTPGKRALLWKVWSMFRFFIAFREIFQGLLHIPGQCFASRYPLIIFNCFLEKACFLTKI